MQDQFTHEEDFSAGQDVIVDTPAQGGRWNSFSHGISKLPDELLVQVLLYSQQNQNMLVCRRWRGLIVSHACFWSTIFAKGRPEWLRLALSRSKSATLHLAVDPSTLASALPDMIPHRDRIRSLRLERCQSYAQVTAVFSLIQAPFGALTVLQLQTPTDDRPDTGYFVLRPEHYPQLATLILTGVHVQWTSSLLSQLTTLSLKFCSIWPSPMDGDTFLDVLQHGQRLTTLMLQDFMSAACSVMSSRARPPISLPRLKLVYLIDTEQWVREFTTRVRTHTPPELALTGEADVGDFDRIPISRRGLLLAPHVTFFPDSGARLHIHATRTTVMLTDWARTQEGAGHKIYSAHTPNGFSAAILSSPTMFCFPSSSLSILDIRVPMRDMDRDTLDTYLEGAPRLRYLHIGCGKDASHALPAYVLDILAACAYDYEDGAYAALVRWPDLTYLGLGGLDWDGGAVMDAALNCLRIREADGARQLEYLAIRVKPRHREGKAEEWGEWEEVDIRYAERLEDMVSCEFSFAVGPDLRGVY